MEAAGTKIHVTIPGNVYALAVPSFEKHVRDQLTYSHWRAAVVSWLLAQGYAAADYLITPAYREDMVNPLEAYIEHRLALPTMLTPPPQGLAALFDAIRAVDTQGNTSIIPPTKKRSHDEAFDEKLRSSESSLERFFADDENLDSSSESGGKKVPESGLRESDEPSSQESLHAIFDDDDDDDDDIEDPCEDDDSQLVPYTPNPSPQKRRRLVTPPAAISEGISTESLAFLMEGKRSDTVFGSNYFVLDNVMRVGKIIEGLRMLKRAKVSIHTWAMMRITAVDHKTRKVTCDLSIFDTHLPEDQHVLVTYDMDSYALRPVILASDRHDKAQGHLSNWPEHHYCMHTTRTGAIKTPQLASTAHAACYDRVRRDRAIQDVDVHFTQVRLPTRK